MIIIGLIGIAVQKRVSISRQVQLIKANEASQINYPFAILTGVVPVLSVLQTIPYAQSFSLILGTYGRTGFFITMSASSGMPCFKLTSSKFMYLVINYGYNYYSTVIQILVSGAWTVTQDVEVSNNFFVLFIIGLSVPASQTSVQQFIQAGFEIFSINNWQMSFRSYLNSLYNKASITILRFNNVLEDTGIHILKHRTNSITTSQTIQNLQVGDYCKTNCRVLSGLTRFHTNQKQLYFKMSLLSVDRLQASDIQVPQSSFLVQIYFLNYPEYLRDTQTSPTLPLNANQYFYPYTRSILPCDPCHKLIISGVYQCLRLYEYYSAMQSRCQQCLDYCSFCTGPDFCTICTPFSTSNSQFTQCQCDVQYYPHISHKTCMPCLVLCRTCNSVLCLSCYSNSVLSSGVCLCDLKYFLPTGGKTCSVCTDGCLLCSSSSSCRTCILEAQLQSGQCRCISQQQVIQKFACVPCNPECLSCYPDNTCSCSKMGQFLGPLDVCFNCSANCLSCAKALQCLRCQGSWILADGRCFEQCPAHSTFNNKTLDCLCDPPYYSRFNQSSLQCYLDQSLNGWSAQRLQALVKTQDSARNASRQISNVLSVLLIVGVATLLGDAIESFAILKLHLFYVLPIHPFLDVVFNVFERIFSGDLFGKLIGWLESQFADLQLSPVNLRLAGYTKKRIFLVNSATFFLQVLGIMAKQLLLTLLKCIVKSINFKHKPLTRALHQSRGLLSCSKTEQLTFVSIQLLSFSLGWAYLINSLLSLLVVSLILFAQFHRKKPNYNTSREQALCTVVLNARVMLIACFIFFSTSIYLQAVPPVIMNSIALTGILYYKQHMRKFYWIRNLVETGSVLSLQIYLLLGAFYNQSVAYSNAVYAIVAVCLAHVGCTMVLMFVRLYRFANRIFKTLRKQKTKNRMHRLSKRKLKYFK